MSCCVAAIVDPPLAAGAQQRVADVIDTDLLLVGAQQRVADVKRNMHHNHSRNHNQQALQKRGTAELQAQQPRHPVAIVALSCSGNHTE